MDNKKMSQNVRSNDHLNNSSEDEYLEKMKGIVCGTAMPIGFDTWSTKEQHDWLDQNIRKYFPNVPETLQNIIPGAFSLIDYNRPQEKLPEWVDMDKYRRGQKFVREHYFSIVVTLFFGAIYSYTFNDVSKPIIIGGNSHTLFLALKRYLSTVKRVFTWFNGEPWVKDTEAYRNMQFTRKKHLMIGTKVSQMDNEQYYAASKIANSWCPEYELLRKDFATTCPFEEPRQRPYKMFDGTSYKLKSINDMTMAITQANFVLLPVLYPQNIGIHGVTDEDLEAYCHMWKCYGYFLGIKDEYNLCHGNLEDIKRCLRDLTQYWTKVNFKDIEPEFVYITKCIIISLRHYYSSLYLPYKTAVLLFTEILNLNMPNLYASLSYTEWIAYKMYRFLLHHALKFSSVRSIINRLTYKIFEAVLYLDSKKMAKLHEKTK
ncbi:uncharacterized protein LOC105183050 [Harpegnathos saltator]|uniref:uncharacterized protein LOC105183050 n=1 Tax=Harpegnathos saltator TaxID=610380 RepID=UPI00058B8726|nr:uncharacterized protein LOC105183050 [Harpegnathos saltator]